MDDIVSTVSKLLKRCKSSEVEVEARIRKQLVNKGSQLLLVDGLGAEWTTEAYTEKRRISKSSRKCVYRQRISSQGVLTICKSSIVREEINDAWCTMHVSIETPTPFMHNTLEGIEPVSLTRQRAEVEGHYVDVVHDGSQGYRVEVEVCDASNFDPDSTLRVIGRVCALLQGSREFVSYYDWLTIVHIARTSFGPFCIDLGNYQKPRTMTMDSLSEIKNVENWFVTPKVDGERRFLVALDDRVFSVGLAKDVKFEGRVQSNEGIFILDCEYTKDPLSRNEVSKRKSPPPTEAIIAQAGQLPLSKPCVGFVPPFVQTLCRIRSGTRLAKGELEQREMYHVFDAVVKNKEYLGGKEELPDRLETAKELLSAMSDDLRARINIKTHRRFDSFDKLCALYNEFAKSSMYKIDGLIFVNITKEYMQQVPKWKVHSTVDLMVTKDNELLTCDEYSVEVPVVKTEEPMTGIWEFDYDKDNNLLCPKRPRPDKPQANSKSIVEINMFFAVPGSIFSGVGCYLMRKYHNIVKKSMISKANEKNATIVDIGTGQGGDVGKWKRARYVYCIEPASESTDEMIRRHGNMQNVHVINRHLRYLDHSEIEKKIDIFTVFFCMNQFEDADWASLEKLIKRKGSTKCRLLAIAMTTPNTHKGKCFDLRITNVDKYNISIHNTRILDLNEKVVNYTTLTKRMKKCGLELTEHKMLDSNDYDFMTIEERKLSSMYEMFVYKKQLA